MFKFCNNRNWIRLQIIGVSAARRKSYNFFTSSSFSSRLSGWNKFSDISSAWNLSQSCSWNVKVIGKSCLERADISKFFRVIIKLSSFYLLLFQKRLFQIFIQICVPKYFTQYCHIFEWVTKYWLGTYLKFRQTVTIS